jgi:hypothetical protein
MPSSLCRLFATILVFCEPKNAAGLWTKHFDAMAEDFKHKNPNPHWVEQMVLINIRNMLQSMKSKDNDKDINKFPLPKIDDAFDDASVSLVRYLRRSALRQIQKMWAYRIY